MFRFLLACALVALTVPPALAAPGPVLRVGVERLDYYPFYVSDGRGYRGYARDLLDAYADSRGLRFSYEPMEIPDQIRLFLGSDRLDFAFPDHPAWNEGAKQGKAVRYSQPVGTLVEGLVVRRGEAGRPLARVRRVGIVKGFVALAIRREVQRGQIAVFESQSLDALFQLLALGRLDAVYVDFQVARLRLALLKLDGKLVADPTLPFDRHELHLSSRLHPERIADFDRFLLREAGMVNALKRRYGLH